MAAVVAGSVFVAVVVIEFVVVAAFASASAVVASVAFVAVVVAVAALSFGPFVKLVADMQTSVSFVGPRSCSSVAAVAGLAAGSGRISSVAVVVEFAVGQGMDSAFLAEFRSDI